MFKYLDAIAKKVNAHPNEYSNHYHQGLATAHAKLIKYFNLSDNTPIYCVALVLHPSYWYDYFYEQWANEKHWIVDMKVSVKLLYQEYIKEATPAEVPIAIISETLNSDEEYKQHGKPSDKYRAKKHWKIRSELDKWIEDGVQQEDENIEDPLA